MSKRERESVSVREIERISVRERRDRQTETECAGGSTENPKNIIISVEALRTEGSFQLGGLSAASIRFYPHGHYAMAESITSKHKLLYLYMYVYMRVCVCTQVRMYVCMYICVFVYCMYSSTYVWMDGWIDRSIDVCIHIHIFCVYVPKYVRMYVFLKFPEPLRSIPLSFPRYLNEMKEEEEVATVFCLQSFLVT